MPVYPYFGSLLGNRSRHEEEACRHHFFSGKEAAEYLLADGKSIDCPFYGKFVEKKQKIAVALLLEDMHEWEFVFQGRGSLSPSHGWYLSWRWGAKQ